MIGFRHSGMLACASLAVAVEAPRVELNAVDTLRFERGGEASIEVEVLTARDGSGTPP